MRKRQLERSFYEFVLDAFHAINPTENLIPNWHMRVICDRLQMETFRIIAGEPKTKDIIINIPPRSLKSFICTVAWPAWSWIHAPWMKFIGSSYSGDLSLEHNVMTKDIVESSWYQSYWGDIVQLSKNVNTKELFETTRRGRRTCTSTGGSVTGKGGHAIIVDDPLNPKKAVSDAERKTANDFFDRTISTRLDNPSVGVFIIIMQRLHELDLTGYLLEKEPDRFDHICIPAELIERDGALNVIPASLAKNYTNGLFFPKRFSKEVLARLRSSLTSYGYAGQFMQTPRPEGGGHVDGRWFGRYKMASLPADPVWNFVADTAYTEKKKNDPSGFMSYCVHENNIYIRNFTVVYKNFPDLIKFIKTYVKEHGYTRRSRIYIEPKASGLSAVQELRKKTNLNVIIGTPPKDDKLSRLSAATPSMEAQRWFLLDNAHWVDDFIYQLEIFPNGKHDECADLCSMIHEKSRKRKSRMTFPKSNA